MAETRAIADDEPWAETIREAGDAMIMLITRSTWETLLLQGAAEGVTPGQVLDKALRAYLEEHGSKKAVEYLHAVAREHGQ